MKDYKNCTAEGVSESLLETLLTGATFIALLAVIGLLGVLLS